MPTPRYHGGAPIQYFPLNLPGFKGLNTQAEGAVLGPEWATTLENTVLDNQNRVAARNGWATKTSTAAADDFRQMVEYKNSGTFEIIAPNTAGDAVYKSADDGSTWTDISGTGTITDADMQLVVFNDVVLGFQSGGTVIKYTGTGSFTNLGATGEPQGRVALAAFGRVWAVDSDGYTIKYCALLDETDWNGTDTGSFDMTSIWQTQDQITALAEFNGTLVVFSRQHIVFFTDGQGSALGLDPVQAYVADTVSGIGCIARDSIANVKGDLWFLDETGVYSLGRLIAERSNPIQNISANIQDELRGYVDRVSDLADVRAVYSPQDRFYLLSLPVGGASSENGVAICFDTRSPMEDRSHRVTGIWTQMVPRAMLVRSDTLALYIARQPNTGEVGTYTGYQDDGAAFTIDYESGWTDLGDPYLKMVKRVSGLLFIQSSATVTFKWAFDFQNEFQTAQVIFPGGASAAEFGEAEYGIGEYGGGVILREKKVGGKGTGGYVRVGMSMEIDGAEVSCQQLALFAKQGRIRG